jgi:hypothetical protein
MVPALLVLVSIGFVICFGLLVFGRGAPTHRAPAPSAGGQASTPLLRTAPDPELDRRRREVDELKATVAELRGELKQTRKKLHDQREAEKGGADLVKARVEVERTASQQLEVVRGELASALADMSRLKSEAEAFRTRRPAPAPQPAAPAPVPVVAAPAPAPEPRRFRELSDTDREKMERLEHLANRERSRSQELSAEVRRLKGRTETQARVYTVIKGELDLLKDKFKALEKRLNRTLLERDLLRRAIRDLEKKSGLAADRTELTADEVAASDRTVEERAAAEAAEIARRTRPTEPVEGAGAASTGAAADSGASLPEPAAAEPHAEKAG